MNRALSLLLILSLSLHAQETNPAPITKPSGADTMPPEANPGDFGSNQPVERADLPERGQIRIAGDLWKMSTQAHWEEYTSTAHFPRPGHYRVRVTYTAQIPVPVQFRLGEQRLRESLPHSAAPRFFSLGVISIDKEGEFPIQLFTPLSEKAQNVNFTDITFVPTSGQDPLVQAADGSISLPASAATTWSEIMRFEPQPGKDCLGFWVNEKDWAEWEFEIAKPGCYQVTVVQGCGAEGGSEILIETNGQTLPFTVKATGGYQNWETLSVGKIAFPTHGLYRLSIKPVSKIGGAIMDLQQLTLTPAE